MVRWLRWHCPPDTGFEIRALAVWGRARYLSVTEAPHNTNFHTWMGKKQFCFCQTAETGNRTPDSGVKGSGANHYPRAPARRPYIMLVLPLWLAYFRPITDNLILAHSDMTNITWSASTWTNVAQRYVYFLRELQFLKVSRTVPVRSLKSVKNSWCSPGTRLLTWNQWYTLQPYNEISALHSIHITRILQTDHDTHIQQTGRIFRGHRPRPPCYARHRRSNPRPRNRRQ